VVVGGASHGVGVEAEEWLGVLLVGGEVWELLGEFVFESLGAEAEEGEFVPGVGAGGGEAVHFEAVVALDIGGVGWCVVGVVWVREFVSVVDEVCVAVVAGEGEAAVGRGAGDEGGVSATVEEEDGLSVVFEGVAEGVFERRAECVEFVSLVGSVASFFVEVDDGDAWHREFADAFGEFEEVESGRAFGVVGVGGGVAE
jgi:hypothetical protein